MSKELNQMIKKFLQYRRGSDGGYANITDDDVNDLYKIVYKLIEEKCEADPDGGFPIDLKIIDRTKYEPMHFFPIPYLHKAEGKDKEEQRMEILDWAMTNARIANERVNNIIKQIQYARSVIKV